MTVLAGSRATRAKRVNQERVVLQTSARVEADEAIWSVSLLEGELVGARRAQDAAEGKLPSLVHKAVAADR
jgi:hypothetical protein